MLLPEAIRKELSTKVVATTKSKNPNSKLRNRTEESRREKSEFSNERSYNDPHSYNSSGERSRLGAKNEVTEKSFFLSDDRRLPVIKINIGVTQKQLSASPKVLR